MNLHITFHFYFFTANANGMKKSNDPNANDPTAELRKFLFPNSPNNNYITSSSTNQASESSSFNRNNAMASETSSPDSLMANLRANSPFTSGTLGANFAAASNGMRRTQDTNWVRGNAELAAKIPEPYDMESSSQFNTGK